jgi:hypothetical protein
LVFHEPGKAPFGFGNDPLVAQSAQRGDDRYTQERGERSKCRKWNFQAAPIASSIPNVREVPRQEQSAYPAYGPR